MGVVRLRRRYNPATREMEDIPLNAVSARVQSAYIQGDYPDYESPVTGLVVHGRRGRREDLKRHGCRPWEGMAAEKKEAARIQARNEERMNARVDAAVERAWAETSPRQRRALRGW